MHVSSEISIDDVGCAGNWPECVRHLAEFRRTITPGRMTAIELCHERRLPAEAV